jgi:hypothetical protein
MSTRENEQTLPIIVFGQVLRTVTWQPRWVKVMLFNVTFNNISAISCQSVLGENHRPAASHWKTLLHSTPRHERDSNSQL